MAVVASGYTVFTDLAGHIGLHIVTDADEFEAAMPLIALAEREAEFYYLQSSSEGLYFTLEPGYGVRFSREQWTDEELDAAREGAAALAAIFEKMHSDGP